MSTTPDNTCQYGLHHKSHILIGDGTLYITSAYGTRLHPISGKIKHHSGIDCAMWLNEKLIECPIGAYEDGIVVVAHPCDDNPRGVHITIDHGNGLITKYFHIEINKLYVKVGDYVKKGNPIGYMGTTGASTGEHLHFQVELNGIPVNPIPYLV